MCLLPNYHKHDAVIQSLLKSMDILWIALDAAYAQDDTETVNELMSLLEETVRILDARVAKRRRRRLT